MSRFVVATCAGLRPLIRARKDGYMHRDEGNWSMYASAIPYYGPSVASMFLRILFLHDLTNRKERGVR